jgi:hypothetical protein
MNRKIIVFSSINFFVFSPECLTEEWIRYRINVFMKTMRISMESQTYKDFVCLVRYHPSSKEIIEKILREYKKLPSNIIFTLDISIRKNFVSKEDEVYYVRIDSDDMYHPTFIEKLSKYNHKPDTKVLISQNGYIYDSINHRLAKYFDQSPPFLVYVHQGQKFINGEFYAHPNGHAGATTLPHEILEGFNYCVVVHGKNTSTRFDKKGYTKEEIVGEEYTRVIKEFNISI